MRAMIVTAAVLVAGLMMSEQATAANPHNQASITLAAHHGPGPSHYGPPHHGYGRPPHGPSYQHYGPSRHYGCYPPVYVRPPVVVPYPAYPYGYYRGYSYYQGGMSINTGRVGISIGF